MSSVGDETVDDLGSKTCSSDLFTDIATKLIDGNFLLTALEFHTELIEAGKEVRKLKEFFSNPGNFESVNKPEVLSPVLLPRSSSQATLDSLDLARYSEDGERANDDRVAILEFELRKARETIIALRTNLTVATESESKQLEENQSEGMINCHPQKSIKPHEQRALNFLINEYLLLHGYKLTSITFADENEDQDFEDWDDVRLNISRPVELLTLYRKGLISCNMENYDKVEAECQVDIIKEVHQNILKQKETEIETLNQKIELLESQRRDYIQRIQDLENQIPIEVISQKSLSPDEEYFEMIGEMKSREESENKSEQSNDWTKIGEKYKKDGSEVKSDNQSNFESVSEDDKIIETNRISNFFEAENDDKNESPQEDFDLDVNSVSETNKTISNDQSFEVNEEQEKVNVVESFKDKKSYSLDWENVSREVPEGFKNEIYRCCDISVSNNLEEDIFNLLDSHILKELTVEHIILILSNVLPKVIPSIILSKREEITPLLIISVCLNSNQNSRDRLLNLLFNLKKKPQVEERQTILHALLIIAQSMGAETVENEILPQCWEQITHKHVERRLLVAESCCLLAPYVTETLRNSLMLSILQQLLQDREEKVREASTSTLTLIIALMSDEDKYSQVLDIGLNVLNDDSEIVLKTAKQLLFPALAQWSLVINRLQSDLFKKLLLKLKKEKKHCILGIFECLLPYLVVNIASSEYSRQFISNKNPLAAKRHEFSNLCKGLCDPSLFYSGSIGSVMGAFDFCTSNPILDTSNWNELNWILIYFIPELLEVCDTLWDSKNLVMDLISTFRYLCIGLGKNVTNNNIKPYLLSKLEECENSLVEGEECKFAIIPMYLVGVLSTDQEVVQEMSNTLRRFICALPLCGVSLSPLFFTIEGLCQHKFWQILVLDSIWEGVVHQRPLVRSAAATLFQSAIPFISESLLTTKVTPALVTLSSDPEISVRTSSIPTLGMLSGVNVKEIRDKVNMTLQNLLLDSSTLENHSMIIQLVNTLREIYEKTDPSFREEVIVPQLAALSAFSIQTKSHDLVSVLTEAFSTVSYSHCRLTPHTISTALIPGLRYLEIMCRQWNLPYLENIDSMIKEGERQANTALESNPKPILLSPLTDNKKLLVSGGVVVEDMKDRVTKMFNTRPNTLQNVSNIFKKKP